MSVTICSIFRDSSDYIHRYFTQIAELEQHIGPVRLVLGEGDSTDSTRSLISINLHEHSHAEDELVDVSHGGAKYGSVDHPVRWAQISYCCNKVLDALGRCHHPVIWIESDLIWDPKTMVRLLADLDRYPAVAPMSMYQGRFYDIWGHRGEDGKTFTMHEPYHHSLEATQGPMVRIGSAGSCIAMVPEVAAKARFGAQDAIVGFCRSIKHDAHASLWLDRRVAVEHP